MSAWDPAGIDRGSGIDRCSGIDRGSGIDRCEQYGRVGCCSSFDHS